LYEWAGGSEAVRRLIERLAMHNSQPGAGVVAHAPVPRWGWGVAPPYRPGGS
jgi:hypothetical protein